MTTETSNRVAPPASGASERQEAPPPASADGELANRSVPASILRHLVMIVASIVMIYPLLWLIVSSLRPQDEIFRNPGLWPLSFDLTSYIEGWTALSFPFTTYIVNSTIVTAGAVVGNLVSCALAAYAFARISFRLRPLLFGIMLVTIMIPFHVILVPQYVFFSQLDLVNTFVPLILPKFLATDAFFIFLMVQFIRGIPRELDEAATIDGAGHGRIFLQLILPLMTPALAATAVFTFIGSWNDFFGALIYLTRPEVQTLPVALRAFLDASGTSSYGPMFAMSIVSLVPVFFAFLFGQKYLVRGIATTGLK